LFDVDGTLIDTAEMIYQCFKHTCSVYGEKTITREQVYESIGVPLRPQIEMHLGRTVTDNEYEKMQKTHMDYQMTIYREHLKLFEGVLETLTQLKGVGKKLAVVTSRRKQSLIVYLEETGIVEFFDAIITPEDTTNHKPHPAPALLALEKMQGKASESLFIGDATFDIECGKNAGTDTAFVEWSMNSAESLNTEATYYITDMKDLL